MFLICIDGSGPRGSDEYRDAQKGSFVRELFDEFQTARVRSLYLRGPNTGSFGLRRLMARQCPSQVRSLATMAEATVLRLWREGVRGPVGFAGHSRGGAACIEACRRLQSSLRELRVDLLALFDAVDRDPF